MVKTTPWFHKLNVDNIPIKGFPCRPSSKRLFPPTGRGFCSDIRITPGSYIKFCTDSSATILMPVLTKLVNSDFRNCLPDGGCQNSVLHVLKPESSKHPSGTNNQTRHSLPQCKDEKVETPHPSSPTRNQPAGAHRPSAAPAHDLCTLSSSTATTPRSSFSKTGADKYRYSKRNRHNNNENCAADHVAEKKVVLKKGVKQSRNRSTAGSRTSTRSLKQKNGIPDRYNGAVEIDSDVSLTRKSPHMHTKNKSLADAINRYNEAVDTDSQLTLARKSSTISTKTKGPAHSKSKPKVTFDMPIKVKADSAAHALLLPSASRDGSSLVYGTAIMPPDLYFSRFDGYSSTSSLTSDDNMFSSFEQNLVNHSSRSRRTDRLQALVGGHESQAHPRVKARIAKQGKNTLSSVDDTKAGLVLHSNEPWQLKCPSSPGSLILQADIVKMNISEKENVHSYQSPSTQCALPVGRRFNVSNAKKTTITYQSPSSHRDFQMTNIAAPVKLGTLKHDIKSNVKLLQIKNADADKAQLLLDLGGGGHGSTPPAGWMSCRETNNAKVTWRSSTSHTSVAAAASGTVQKKPQLMQARWELTETPLVWVDSGDDDTASSASCLTPASCHQPSHSIFARLGNNNVAAATPGATTTPASEIPVLIRKQSMTSKTYSTNQTNSTAHHSVHSDALSMTKDDAFESAGADQSSVAVVKCSKDPFVDFQDSMVDMMVEKQIKTAPAMEELLQCFLSLNKPEHHPTIIRAFTHVWNQTFQEPDMTDIKSPTSSYNPSPWRGFSPNYYTM